MREPMDKGLLEGRKIFVESAGYRGVRYHELFGRNFATEDNKVGERTGLYGFSVDELLKCDTQPSGVELNLHIVFSDIQMGAIVKKLVVSVAAFAALGLVNSASAADMPVKAPVMVAPVANWNGYYIGVNGGYAWGTTNHTDQFGVTTNNFGTSGGLFGVTYGANWQWGRWVLGFEGDFDLASINGTFTSAALCSINGGTTCFTNLKNFSTDRLRAGYDLNGWLLFATGGFGFGQVNAGQNPCGPVPINIGLGIGGGNSCNEKWRSGWVAGAGVEKMIMPHWSVKLEYLHYDFGNDFHYTPTTILGGSSVHVLERGDMVRLGINYRFGTL